MFKIYPAENSIRVLSTSNILIEIPFKDLRVDHSLWNHISPNQAFMIGYNAGLAALIEMQEKERS